MKTFKWFSIVFFALMLFGAVDAFACSCPSLPQTVEVKWKLRLADAVFVGKVVEIANKSGTRDVIVRITATEVWKGPVTHEISITTDRHPGMCGYPFEVGETYLVFGRRNSGPELATGLCLRNLRIEKASEELKILGKGKTPKRRKSNAPL